MADPLVNSAPLADSWASACGPGMMIEWLQFRVPPGHQQYFIAADERIWDRVLRQQPGFIRKETWLDPSDPQRVFLIIYWTSRDHCTAVPKALLQALDQEMQPHYLELELAHEYCLSRISGDPDPDSLV